VVNEANGEPSKGFAPVNTAGTGHEAYVPTSYMMMMVMIMMMMITMRVILF
jgi:hypothetical protein